MKFVLLLSLAVALKPASAQIQVRWPSCSICFDGQSVTETDSVLTGTAAGLVGESANTCPEVETMAQEGGFSPATCFLLRRELAETCGCEATEPTSSPVVAPTEAPVVPPTEAPVLPPTEAPVLPPTNAPVVPTTDAPIAGPTTEAPVDAPTEAPVAAPTEAPVPTTGAPVTTAPTGAPVISPTDAPVAPPAAVSAPLALTLPGLTGDLSPEDETAFLEACQAFLAAQLPGISNLQCALAPEESRRSRQLRGLQEEEPTTVNVIVSGEGEGLSAEMLGEDVSAAISENADDFVQTLAEASETFSDVTGIDVETGDTATDRTPSVPATTDGGGLSPGGIVGIVLALAIIVAGAAYFISQQQKKNESAPFPEEPVSEVPTIMVNPPPPRNFAAPKAPVASEIAVSVARSVGGSVIGGASAAEGTSVAEGTSMEGYSMSAASHPEGNTTGRSADATSVSSNAMSSLRQNMVSRTVTVLPGKLGIVVDTTLEGPVVNKVNEDSPLLGVLFQGDIIVAVDDIDTRAMSASSIYALMIRTSKQERKLTVLSEDYADGA